MSRHEYHDGRGLVKIYSVLSGCSCAWCTAQRRGAPHKLGMQEARRYDYDDTGGTEDMSDGEFVEDHEVEMTGETAGERLYQLAAERMRAHGIPYTQALPEVMAENPGLAQQYLDSVPIGKRHRRKRR
jgi:hypothetical protein